MDTIGTGLCDTQIVHLHSSASGGSSNAKGGEDAERLGLEYRKETHEEDNIVHADNDRDAKIDPPGTLVA